MAKWTACRVDDLFRRRVICLEEACEQAILLSATESAREVIGALSPEIVEIVRTKVASAPASDEEWERSLSIFGGTYTSKTDHEAETAKSRSINRAGIEALRKYFAFE